MPGNAVSKSHWAESTDQDCFMDEDTQAQGLMSSQGYTDSEQQWPNLYLGLRKDHIK